MKSDSSKVVSVNMDAETWEQLKRLAARERRSLSGQIMCYLERGLEEREGSEVLDRQEHSQ